MKWRILAEGEEVKSGDEGLGRDFADAHSGDVHTCPRWGKINAALINQPKSAVIYRRQIKPGGPKKSKPLRKDASQIALSTAEQVTGGKLRPTKLPN